MIVGIGTGCTRAEYLTLGNLADKEHVAAQIDFFLNHAGEHSLGILCHVQQAVAAALRSGNVLEFVHFPSGLHTEMANGFKGDVLCQHADIEYAGFLDDFPGQVLHLAGNCQPGGLSSHLHAGVDDTAIVFFIP